MSLLDEVRRSARALDGAAFALAHTLRDKLGPPATTATFQEAEAVCISTRAVLDELSPLEPLLASDANVVGRTIRDSRVRNGFDSLATILVTLLDNATAAVLDVAGTIARPPLGPTGAFERMTTHHGQLRAMYGIVHLAAKVVQHADVSRTPFVDVTGSPAAVDLDPMKWRAAIKMDDFYGRYFGFHYAPEMRNVLRVVIIARGSVDSTMEQDATANAPALVKNVAMLGWGWIYTNIVLMNNLGLNIGSVSKIGADKGVRPSIESVRTFMNLVEDPVVAGVSGLASADAAIDRAFQIPSPQKYGDWRQLKLAMLAAAEDLLDTNGINFEVLYEVFCTITEPVSARLMSSKRRPATLASLCSSDTPVKERERKSGERHTLSDTTAECHFANFNETDVNQANAHVATKLTSKPVPLDTLTNPEPAAGLTLAISSSDKPKAPQIRPSKSLSGSPRELPSTSTAGQRKASRSLQSSPEGGRRPTIASSFAGAAESSYLASALKTEFSRLHSNVSSFLGLAQTPPASGLIIHFHGGGFVSQSSVGHSVYLKEWCADMPDAVLLSIDYKLAPEHRFPVALHECVYAYQWALTNAASLGTCANRVVFVGDSAGGNLALATALLADDIGLRRPDGVCVAYPSLYLSRAWSPSRLLSFFDPLLPLSVLELCMESYLSESQQMRCTKDPYISPVVASDDQLRRLPPVIAICGELDPLLDDSALLADRLHRAGRKGDVFRIYKAMPHGFLNMTQVSEQARAAMSFLSTHMAEFLRIQFRNTRRELVEKERYPPMPQSPAEAFSEASTS